MATTSKMGAGSNHTPAIENDRPVGQNMSHAKDRRQRAQQALGDAHETGHLLGDVPALLIVAGVLWVLSPSEHGATAIG
ncbi:MAG TPA: hypothetical protein EYP98_04650 [Planctomycetes bacterium]|nr:hypothetical protein [Planctomycetota bacterium]